MPICFSRPVTCGIFRRSRTLSSRRHYFAENWTGDRSYMGDICQNFRKPQKDGSSVLSSQDCRVVPFPSLSQPPQPPPLMQCVWSHNPSLKDLKASANPVDIFMLIALSEMVVFYIRLQSALGRQPMNKK